MEYLLFLQAIREQSGAWLCSLADWVTKFSVSYWPFAIVSMIYWVFDRKAGRRLLGGVSFGLLFNGFLKVTFCVLRPWLRDPRIEPWGDSKVAATGYSFPSGHASFSTALLVGSGWWERKRHIYLTVAAFVMEAMIMLSRNFLGVHTLEDVLVGFASSCLALVVAAALENWTDQDPSRDRWYIVGGLVLCVLLVLYYEFKSFPLVYTEDGSLLVDPVKMRSDSFEGIGALSTFVICRYIERRRFQFDKLLSWKNRFIIGTFAMIPGYWLFSKTVTLVQSFSNRSVGKYAWFTVMLLYTMLLVPYVMEQIAKRCKWVQTDELEQA